MDDHAFLREAYSLLKIGGHLILTSVLKTSWAYYYLKNSCGERVLETSHLREYGTKKEFIELIEDKGFKVNQCETASIRFPFVDPFFKFLMNTAGLTFLSHITSSRFGNLLRKASRIPIPGYYSIEAVCRKID